MKRQLLAATLMALSTLPAVAQDMDHGTALYMKYCAVCHGENATGGGPMSPNLILQPADLTTLAARNEGVFPAFRVVARIDGREPLVSHGSPMPIFGELFEGEPATLKAPDGQPILTNKSIVDLVAYIEGLQTAP